MKLLLLACLWIAATGASATSQAACPIVKVQVERLSDLSVPRAGHNMFYANGELTVVGGHTAGFKPTATAEYYKDGEWHLLSTVYDHDNGLAVVLKSGKVLLCGGHSEPIGIGQTYLVEWYDPKKHVFIGFGSLDRKRTLAQGVELDSGRVVIVGNHYYQDGIELFDGQKTFSYVKDVAAERMCPYVFRTSDGDAMILGAYDTRYQPLHSAVVDRMKGEPFIAPLLEEWQPMPFERSFSSDVSFIGNEQKGDYSYLLPVANTEGQVAIALVRDTVFTLLPTESAIPMTPFGDSILYDSPAIVDRQAQRAYVVGRDMRDRYYFLSIDYAQAPAALMLYHTDLMPDMGCTIPVLTPDGNLLITGGVNQNNDNFAPLATVWLIHVNGKPVQAQTESRSYVWLWLLFIILIGIVVAFFLVRKRQKAHPRPIRTNEAVQTSEVSALLQRICQLMDEKQLYLRNDLKVQDVAVRLSTNSSYVSECINSGLGQTFSQFVNAYRVRHAQEILRRQPDVKTATVATESGFSTEASFFRNFKAVTGMTPREWLQNNAKD